MIGFFSLLEFLLLEISKNRTSLKILLTTIILHVFLINVASAVEVTFVFWSDKFSHNLPSRETVNNREETFGGVGILSGMIETLRVKHAPKDHVYIMSIGIKPSEQGKGHGSRLLRKIIEECGSEGVPVYLETFKAVNEQIYNHIGFNTKETRDVPGTDLTIYSMLYEH